MEKLIKRTDYLAKIRPFYDSKYIKAITGVRGCGKSELLFQIMEEIKKSGIDKNHIIYLDLERRNGEGITTRLKLEKWLDKKIQDKEKYYIFIDEIQHIKDFEEAIASIRISYNCSLFVTGSNSRLLHGKMQDRLTGRAKEFEIYPFTYKETLEYKKLNNIEIDKDDFRTYLERGGMPQRFEEIDEEGVRNYLISIYESIIEKDVFGTHKKISKEDFEKVARYIIGTTGKKFSALSIAKYLKESLPRDTQKKYSETVSNYAKYLEECYFISECKPFCLKGKETLQGIKKYYAVDSGLRNSLDDFLELDDTFLLENVIYNELRYRGYEVRYGKFNAGEIDFVAIRNKKKCLIQVTYTIDRKDVFEREYGAFSKIRDNSPKFVMSLDEKDTSNNGITHINVLDFLLGKKDVFLS